MSQPTISTELSLGECANLALVFEATAAKPGNVHRGADFEDLTYPDFLIAAALTTPIFALAPSKTLGETVLSAVRATRSAVGTNVNLGTVLLLAPLAAVPREQPLGSGVAAVLSRLTPSDAEQVYEAIRIAQPGGMGQVSNDDVTCPAPADLLSAMRAAADRDLVARQYTNNFAQVLDEVVPSLAGGLAQGWSIQRTIIHVFLETLAKYPDSLIARKCGSEAATRASASAAKILASGSSDSEVYEDRLADLDFWLRSAGHRRNPGTTADLIAAGLFAALRDGIIKPPFRWD
jgi:triphosphoribosyl-dephospho-CoA synthase